jgi:hypothetical protein
VLPKKLCVVFCGLFAALGFAAQQAQQSPQVKVNILNVCSPSADEQKEIASALERVPKQPKFAPDFEVARGRSSVDEKSSMMQSAGGGSLPSDPITAAWVRIRREFSQPPFSNVQYSFSADSKNMIETLVLHVKDPKDLVLLSIEDTASAVTSPATMLSTSTPVNRIKLERFGKQSVVLARCVGAENGPPPDQSAFEPIFRDAAGVVTRYRDALGAKGTVPEELSKVVTTRATRGRAMGKSVKPVVKKSAQQGAASPK